MRPAGMLYDTKRGIQIAGMTIPDTFPENRPALETGTSSMAGMIIPDTFPESVRTGLRFV